VLAISTVGTRLIVVLALLTIQQRLPWVALLFALALCLPTSIEEPPEYEVGVWLLGRRDREYWTVLGIYAAIPSWLALRLVAHDVSF
jgi:hypothetical protein